MIRLSVLGLCLLCAAQYALADSAPLKINQIQFVGSHNSYKQAMSPLIFKALHLLDAKTAESLEYWHAVGAAVDLAYASSRSTCFMTLKRVVSRRARPSH